MANTPKQYQSTTTAGQKLSEWWGKITNDVINLFGYYNNHITGDADRHSASDIDTDTSGKTVQDLLDEINGELDDKQDTLRAGDNITIVDNVISATGGGTVTTDTVMSDTSTNPVQNKVIKAYVDNHSGAVDSVNGKTGTVVLDATNIDYSSDMTIKYKIDSNHEYAMQKQSISEKGEANGYAPLDGNKKIPEQYIYGKTAKEYGIRWTGTSVTACTRLKDAAGLTAQAYRSEIQTYHSDFDNIYPWSDIKLCNVDEMGQVTAYIGEPNFKRDGSNGDVMVEIPKFYYKRTKTGTVEEWWICGEKLEGYELHPAFTDGGLEMHKLFVGAYNGSVETVGGTDKLMSKTGVIPINRKSLGTLRTYARNKGVNWGVEDYACLSALQMLYTVEFADMNSQNVLGKGITMLNDVEQLAAQIIEEATETNSVKIPYGKRNQFPVGSHIQIGTVLRTPDKTTNWRAVTNVVTDGTQSATVTFSGAPISVEENDYIWEECPENGACDFLGGQSGSPDTVYYKDVCYRGIEGIYGKLYQAIDGITIKGSTSYHVSVTMSDYGDAKTTGTYEMLSFVPPAQGYITELGFDTYKPWAILPCAAGGSNNTYIPDYEWFNSGTHELFSGLSSKSNGGEGIFSLFAYSNATGNARLMFKK